MKNRKNVVVNVVICPPCGESTATSGVRGAYKATSLMSPSIGPADHFLRKGGRNGFTLIELLVVVLIIGILAAVAVPQYQKAVDKARYTQAMTLGKKIWESQQRYRLANGKYTLFFDNLDMDMPAPVRRSDGGGDTYEYTWGSCNLHPNYYIACKVNVPGGKAWYFVYMDGGSESCWADSKDNARANVLCHTITKKTGQVNGDYMLYRF